ncbi:PBECR4 domain-containing protein [Streptococcus agalactiae]|uniref:PBECR4 domain-containing protein n=1 Tax=Streptococcus agalactiae TaxID=1311 RepID=UPI0022EA9970|nr:PBECR4 domain-containing protein [Streptococcus agalactiae]
MAEEHTQQPSSRGKSRRERVEYARSRDILDVASELNMELVRSGRDYRWKEHDSMVISPDKNMWNWFSRHQGGDVISLVETMKEVNFNQAIDYLNDGSFKEYTVVERAQEPFSYYLEPYEQPFEAARNYLKEQRGLSDETIDFFLEKGVLAQANAKVNGSIEPVVVFKSFDFSGEIVGATLQGIEENWEKWPERGYAKNIVRNSDGITGLHVDIGQPNRLIFAESAIDLMSYYELHKDSLQDVRLVSMDGVKEAVVGRHLAQLQSELSGRPLRWSHDQLAEGLQTAIDNNFFTDGKHADWITLAVDNDTGGHNFIDSLREKGATINEDLPDLQPGKDKTDWNDALKQHKLLGLSDGMESYQTRSEEQGVLFENLTDVTSTSDHVMEPELQVVFDFSENPKISKQYSSGEVVPYSDFIAKLYEENDWQLISPNSGYDKTYFTLQDEQGSPLISNIRFDIGTEREDLSEQLSQKLPSPYLKLAQKADHDYRAQVSYDTFKANQKRLSEAVQSQIQAGALRITLSDEAYFYTLVNYTGWSHPMQQLKPKAMEGLKEHRSFFESINDTNIDRFKEKGTPEQNQMYDLLKSLQKELGRSNTSTVFSEEVAISAYNLNRRLNSLTAEHWGKGTTDPLGSLGRDTWNVISYPANDIVTDNTDYYDQLVPYHLLEYLNGKNGTVEISPETYETILQQLRDEAIIITPEVVDDVTTSPKQVVSSSEETEKPLEVHQGQGVSVQQKKNETNIRDLSEQAQEAAPLPEATPSQPLKDLSPSQTDSHSLLYFTIEDPNRSIYKDNYHPIKPHELSKLNHHAPNIQSAAQWYLDNLSDTTLHYFYQQENKQYNINIDFKQYHFMHLTGLFPLKRGQTAVKTLHDFAEGRGSYDNLMIADNEAAFQKIKVLPDLKAIMETDAFYFDQVEDIPKLQSLSLEKAIKSDDKDVLLAFSSNEENIYPASLMELTKQLKIQTEQSQHQNVILGVYQERDGEFTQLSINETYITDNGEEMLSILKGEQVSSSDEPSHDLAPSPAEALIDAVTFTKVLDTAYNIGNPAELGVAVPEEFQSSWEQYNQLSEASSGDFKTIIVKADELGLLDKTSAFYQDWQQDQIYNDTYHVRLRGSNEGLISPQLPFEPTQLVSYQDFVTELYKANQDASQTQPIAFDIYAPGGALIKDGVHYAVGDETQPVSRLLGLGYRRLEGYPDLAAIDEEVLSQLENYEVNQDIAAEANEQTVASPETPQERDSKEVFQSPKQSIKTGLAQRVEEIMAEDAAKILVSSIPQVHENLSVEGDLIGAPQPDGQMFYTNQEDFGRDYQLELTVHSLVKIDQLSDIQAPWTLALIQGEQKLGYLAYGSDWGNDFQVKKELEQLASQIGAGNSPEGLYQQEEIDAFLTNNRGQESNYRTKENISSAEPFDYKTASAHDVSERAFQKIREYTQSPEDLMEYVEFMSKFPQLSPRNVALIQDQWRGANAVATYDQWQSMGEALGIKPEDVIQTKATYVNKRTGETKEVVHQGLSVKSGEKSQITLFRPLMVRMIPVIDESGNHVKNDKGNPKYKKFSDATRQEKELVKEGKLPVRQFQERDPKTGQPRFTTYKVFELSQTTLKPESYPKAMPNRHYNFNTDKVKTKEVLEGLCDYAESIGVSIMKDEAHVLGNAKGAFFPGEQLILINPDNTPGEKIATTIHELAHATLHNPNLADQYKELPKAQKELEAEMTSHLLSKHFGLDTTEKAIDYMAKWTDNLQGLNDKQLADSLKRIHKTVSKMHKQIEHHTKPYQLGKNRGQGPNFPKAPTKGPSR